MRNRAVFSGLLLLFIAAFTQAGFDCVYFDDPNDYIDDPNTLENARFECGDPNLTEFDFTPPTFWERIPVSDPYHPLSDCYASLIYRPEEPNVPAFTPLNEFGFVANWYISAPYEGDSFVLLSTDLWPNTDEYPKPHYDYLKSSTIQQQVSLEEGDTIMGAYFFGTVDYRSYYDFAEINLEPSDPNISDPNSIISLVHVVIGDVNDFQSTLELSPETGGWLTFSYTIEPNQVGNYFIKCKVEDNIDRVYDSFLGIDNFRICRGGKPVADLDWDCDVDLVDFAVISEAWLAFCPDDPNFIDPNMNDPNVIDPNVIDPNVIDPNVIYPIYDPNVPCQLADIDNSWYVDVNDLRIFSDEWLFRPIE